MRSSARAVARAKSRRVGAGLSCSLVACCSSAPTSSPHTEELFRERLRDTVDRFLRAEDTKGVNQANIICKNFLDSLEQVRPADTRRVAGSGEDSVFANNFVDMEEVRCYRIRLLALVTEVDIVFLIKLNRSRSLASTWTILWSPTPPSYKNLYMKRQSLFYWKNLDSRRR